MKFRTTSHLIAVLAVTTLLGGCNASKTPDTASASPPLLAGSPASAAASTTSAPAEAEAAPTAIPESADAIWKAVDQQNADLKDTIASGNLKEVHHKAFAIRDLVAALPAHSPSLSADDQTKLQGEIKFVATLADRLDAAGDSNDKACAQSNYDKLVTVLNGITRTK